MTAPLVLVSRLTARDGAEARSRADAVLRERLGELLGRAAATIEISRVCEHCGDERHGRPFVVDAGDVSFSVSHSDRFAVVAVAATNARLGVDIEVLRPRPRLEQLAARVLNPSELDGFFAADAAMRLERFLRAWTTKEAYLKATGVGIATNLRAVSVPDSGWTVHAIDAPGSYIGCVVAQGDLDVDARSIASDAPVA
ncbi:MAG TPA: 4'-phosphopantetheinyl transferase superfamily protein [Acidimicrobiia bacterium]|nr:4'-phosphopantetheinyl transferase superfamily protein [Acidimicrobiia bacterium]